jgi:RHH-type rel operon transcriptional repressor/antitoxin RelB
MTQVTARLPDSLVREMDTAAQRLSHSRTQFVRRAIEYYLEDLEDLRLGLERLQDPADPVLDWEDVRRELLHPD